MTISKFTTSRKNMINVSNHNMSPREDDSVEFQASSIDETSQTLDILEKDSRHLVKNVPRVDLARLLGKTDDESESEESEEFASDSRKGALKRRSSIKHFVLPLKEPARRRCSITKYSAPLREASKLSTRTPSADGNRTRRILNKKRAIAKQDFQTRVRDTLGKNSLHLHRDRMQGKNVVTPKAA